MNRKIMLLPLAAAVLMGLASCGPDASSSNGGDDNSSTAPAVYDGGISDVEVGDVQVSGVVAQKGSKGWILDDGKASVYVFGTLADEFKVGDHVLVSATCEGYWGLYELKSATVTAAPTSKAAPVLADPVEITAADIKAAWNITSAAESGTASWSPTNSKRYKITGLTAESVSGYAGWSIDGFEKKLVSYYYVPGNNVTEANRSTKLYAGCKYDVSFYMVGNNSAKNVNMAIFDVTAHYDAVESVSLTGDASVETGASKTLTASVLPATADQGLTWSSSDESKATVNSSGKVTGVAEGSVIITATSTADSTKKAEFAMTVVKGVTYNKVGALSFNKDDTVVINNKLEETTDPYISYTSTEGVSIAVRKGTSTNDVNVWKSSYSSCRWYVGHNVVISHANDFDRIVLTCDSGYSTFGDVTLPTGATSETVGEVITITLASKVKSITLDMKKQIRPSNVELKASVAE